MEDIHYNISSDLADTLSLINYCSTDSNARRLCSTRSFWENQFNRFNLPLDEDVYYTNTYDWIQLLLKTQYVMDKLNQLPSKMGYKTVLLNINVLLDDIINMIEEESDIVVNDLKKYLVTLDDPDPDFMEAINQYPFMINQILLTKIGTHYYLDLIINKNIAKIPGGVNLLQSNDEIVFSFPLKKHQLENMMIKLIPYL